MADFEKMNIAVVGLGYVGLPLAIELAKYFEVIGIDVNEERIRQLKDFQDPNGEVSSEELRQSRLSVTSEMHLISDCEVVVVAVPTPVDQHKTPDLSPVVKASRGIAEHIKRGTIVCYESTVYPGVTEDVCVPVIEECSGLKWKHGFFVGYSPERINPGDKTHTLSTIVKVVAGDTPETLDKLATMYGAAVKAGIHKASSIKVAEAAKVIENTQRDVNIALMNELRIVFDRIGISTKEVLEAAGTKWNFLPFRPGLVGGHCIGVDPYYLAYKAEELGHHPQLILAGRRINDAMGGYFARCILKRLINTGLTVKASRVLICGVTFKENVPDIRNSKVFDIIHELRDFGLVVHAWDPIAESGGIFEEMQLDPKSTPAVGSYDAIVLAVTHNLFMEMGGTKLREYLKPGGLFFDMREAF